MKKLIALLAALLSLVAFPTHLISKPPAYLESIKPLVWQDEGEQSAGPHCTTFNINATAHLWLTAAHCIDNDTVLKTTIGGKLIRVIKWDDGKDLAIVYNETVAPDIPLSVKSPAWGQPVHSVGYIAGESFPIITNGYIGNPDAQPLQMNGRAFVILDMTSGHGASGGPVLTQENQVVTIIEAGFDGGTISPISGGVPYDTIKEFTEGYWR